MKYLLTFIVGERSMESATPEEMKEGMEALDRVRPGDDRGGGADRL